MRLTIANTVSRIGMNNKHNGPTSEAISDPCCEPLIERVESRKPIIRLPESPRKILAGCRLCHKNPQRAPAVAIATRAVD